MQFHGVLHLSKKSIAMISFNFAALLGIIALVNSHLKVEPTNRRAREKLTFEKVIYHSSHCNGDCPAIDLQIDSARNIVLKRDIWKEKGVTDKHASGSFRGKLDAKTYADLIAILVWTDYANLKFPSDACCDRVVTTIAIYANGKRTILSSMSPPEKATELISFLYNLGMKSSIPRTTEKIEIDPF
jgi:hypothetical protein